MTASMQDLELKQALTLLDICPMPVLLQHADGSIRTCNRAFARLAGASTDDIGGGGVHELIAPLLASGTLIQWITADGDERWLKVESVTLDGAGGGTARFYSDITEQLRLRKACDELAGELGELTIRDGHLPSLLSRHGILVSLEPLVARSRRYNSPLTVVTLGIETDNAADRDATLKRTVAVLKDQTRWADLVGCNKFHDLILVLQETTQDAALQLVEKLDEHVAQLNASGAGIQVCYGITECQKNDTATELLDRAEAALREARGNDSGRSIAI